MPGEPTEKPKSARDSEPPPSEEAGRPRMIQAIDPRTVNLPPEDLAAITLRPDALQEAARRAIEIVNEPSAIDILGKAPPTTNPDMDGATPLPDDATRVEPSPRRGDSEPPETKDARELHPVASERRASGRLLAGKYAIGRRIGSGGMATVYEGEHVELGKRIAIKVMNGDYRNHAEIVARFKREARTASAVESEHIVHVFDIGDDPEIGLFLVMELLAGKDLGSILAEVGRLPPSLACAIAAQAAAGLGRAHAKGVVHRDVKPANVFVAENDEGFATVKILDFGVAKLGGEAVGAGKQGLTRVGTVVGTPQYMSPEQAQAKPDTGPRTDVYALGAVLFEMLAGKPLFPDLETPQATLLHVATTPAPRLAAVVPNVDPELDRLVGDMLIADPAIRIGDMEAVRKRLLAIDPDADRRLTFREVVTGGRDVPTSRKLRSAPPRSPIPRFADEPTQPDRRKKSRMLFVAIALAVFVAAVIAILLANAR